MMHSYPFTAEAIASPMPVFPEVASTIVLPYINRWINSLKWPNCLSKLSCRLGLLNHPFNDPVFYGAACIEKLAFHN